MELDKSRTCCFTGHRDMSVLEKKTAGTCVMELIDDLYGRGYRHFITGGAIGFDTLAAVCVITARDTKYPDITLTLAIPCPDQTLKWSPKDKQNYKRIMMCANESVLLSTEYTPYCMHQRNRWMVDHSSAVIAYCHSEKGGAFSTVTYAKKAGAAIINVANLEKMRVLYERS